MGNALALTITFETVTCCHDGCGLTFAAPAWWMTMRRRDHDWWYCPHGHKQHFVGTSDVEKAQAEAERARQDRDYWQRRHAQERDQRRAVELSQRATRGHLTRTKKRIAAGVCPCCTRSFANLHRHMASQHPEYAP